MKKTSILETDNECAEVNFIVKFTTNKRYYYSYYYDSLESAITGGVFPSSSIIREGDFLLTFKADRVAHSDVIIYLGINGTGQIVYVHKHFDDEFILQRRIVKLRCMRANMIYWKLINHSTRGDFADV